MKRLFIVASLAIAAIGCQKTEIQNEVLTPIGFSTEIGKQTRAIQGDVNGYTDCFGVYAYLYNDGTPASPAMMSNQRVTSRGATSTLEDDVETPVSYYWPNDPDNHINFYAYSPYNVGDIDMTDEGTFVLDSYEHIKYSGGEAVDFMVATPALDQTYTSNTQSNGVVPIDFNHEMTQVVFNVVTSFDGGDIMLKSIQLNDIYNIATYTSTTIGAITNWELDENSTTNYNLTIPNQTNGKIEVTAGGVSTTPVTMIPQTFINSTTEPVVNGQSFTIEYDIIIGGVTENVSKTFDFAAVSYSPTMTTAAWNPNAKVVYTLTIGLETISFSPSVENWDDQTGSLDF